MDACLLPKRSKKRKYIAIVMLFTVLFIFWGVSRYPDLFAEYHRADSQSLLSRNVGVLSKDAMLQVHGLQSPFTKIWHATLNWLDTNKKGMTFGFLFGALILLVLEQSKFLAKHARKKGVLGALSGLLLGMPLGVCTNCATPVALGLRKAGSSSVSAFSTLVASPSLNPVGLVMIFMLFPPIVGGMRLVAIIGFLVLVLPILTKLFSNDDQLLTEKLPEISEASNEAYTDAITYCFKRYGFYLSYIVKSILPLMILIGLIAAILVTYLPLEHVLLGAKESWLDICLAGLFASLLPMPMFVDIILVWLFYSVGLSLGLTTTLLITLAPTSLFAFVVMGRHESWRLSFSVLFSIAVLGIISGLYVHHLEISKEKANVPYTHIQGFSAALTVTPKKSFDNQSLANFIGSGVSMIDIDNDGLLDIFLPGQGSQRLFKNQGQGKFIDVTASSGIHQLSNGMAGMWGDINNDGLPDLYIVNYKSNTGEPEQNRLYLNQGNAQFKDVTKAYGLTEKDYSASAAWADFDNDGDLDLFVANYGSLQIKEGEKIVGQSMHNRLYRNDGGRFVEIAKEAGVAGTIFHSELIRDIERNQTKGDRGFSFQPVWFDFDNDGLMDLYVSADFGTGQLYRNVGQGKFENVTKQAGLDIFGTGMGVEVLDVNQDGWFDLLVTTGGENQLWVNDGQGHFINEAKAYGIEDNQRFGWGVAALDATNIGESSLFIVNGVTMNYGGLSNQLSTMARVSNINMFYMPSREGKYQNFNKKYRLYNDELSRGLALGDINNDGRIDLAITNRSQNSLVVYKNHNQRQNSLSISLRGGGDVNRMAIGARVAVYTERNVQHKLVMAGSSFMSQHSPTLHFGLGQAKQVKKIIVTWPNGKKTTLTDVKANRHWLIDYPSGRLKPLS